MLRDAFTLESLLETHDLPVVVISGDLRIVSVNHAWEVCFAVERQALIDQPCCPTDTDCRHRKLFRSLEGYSGIYPPVAGLANDELFSVRGFPLLDANGVVYVGEKVASVRKLTQAASTINMVGQAPLFLQFKENLLQAAGTVAPVLLTGETGTGKELAAEFIHQNSVCKDGEFVIVDCTVISEDLFESELFGHEKGAFTGALSNKKGLFELAHHGTLFLDEVAELPLSQQPKLLRALESGQFRRVGGTAMLKSEVRLVCASHQNLAELVRLGRFREDLFYRLSVFPIQVPSLRERKQDLPLLVDHFLEVLSANAGKSPVLTKSALLKLIQYRWPGNIRELRNCLQLAAALCKDGYITDNHIHYFQSDASVAAVETNQHAASDVAAQSLSGLAMIEADFIVSLMKKYQGNRKLMAQEMNVSERTLYRKINRLNLTLT